MRQTGRRTEPKNLDAVKREQHFIENGKNTNRPESLKNKNRKTLKIAIILFVIAITLVFFVVLKQNTNLFNFALIAERQDIEEQIESGDDKKETEITEDDLEVGRNGYISSAQIIKRATGTGPWDANDEPGNDSSPDNNIVRSFDQVTWTVDITTALKTGVSIEGLKGGVIEFIVSLPEECADVMEWDLSSMSWVKGAMLSEDGVTLSGKYTLAKDSQSVPGKQTLVFVLKIYGATNGTKIAPTFTVNLAGNEENEKKVITDNTITVSAKGKYNIQLKSNEKYLSNRTSVDYGLGKISGKMYGYGFAVQLYNDNESKGLKGIELPKGDISFSINLKTERSALGSSELEDITKEATPILWNYRVNNWSTDLTGNIPDRDMFRMTQYNEYIQDLPLGIDVGDRNYSVLNSGNIQIIQEETTLHVTIKNYEIDNEFPLHLCAWEGAISEVRKKYIQIT